MIASRKRLLPVKVLAAIFVVIFLIAAVALSSFHMDAYEAISGVSGHDVPQTLAMELAIIFAAFMALFVLMVSIVRVSNRRLIDNYRQERRLSHAVTSAEEADHAKSIFLSDISHALRTPLNTIIGFSEIMREETFGPLGNAQYKSYAGDIQQSGRQLLSTINDLLDLSRIQAGQAELDEKPVDLAQCLENVARMWSERQEAEMVTFDFDLPTRLPPIMADEELIRHILQNLLANSIKHTLEGSITVWAHVRLDGNLEFGVTDTGIGIPPEELAELTDRFSQIDESWKRKFEGTGLGLALVKALLAHHDGDVSITSEVGVGTTVTCFIPRERVLLGSEIRNQVA